jgi:hypothetical protein
MPEFFIKLFASKLFGPLASIALVVSLIGNATLGASLWAEKRHSGKLETRVEQLATDNFTLRGNNFVLKNAVDAQNKGVDSLKTAADLAAASAKLGQAAHESAAAAHDAKAAALSNAKPAPGADLCTAASTLITHTLAGEHAK